MRYLGFIACLFLATVTPSPTARAEKKENLEKRRTVELKRVALDRGVLRVHPPDENAWRFTTMWRARRTPRGTLIYLAQWPGPNRGWDEWYLNYDHKGRDGRLGLVPEPGPGCYWKWQEGGWKRQGREGYEFSCTARPLNGPMAGWRLCFQGDRLVLTNKGGEEVQFRGWVDNLDDGK